MMSWVTLNVGGQKFVTTVSTLIKEPDCMFNMFNGQMKPGEKDEEGAYLIDRSPVYFHPILNYLRTGKVIIDPSINVEGVLEEAKYYGIDKLIHLLEELIDNVSEEKDAAKNNFQADLDEEFEKLRNLADL